MVGGERRRQRQGGQDLATDNTVSMFDLRKHILGRSKSAPHCQGHDPLPVAASRPLPCRPPGTSEVRCTPVMAPEGLSRKRSVPETIGLGAAFRPVETAWMEAQRRKAAEISRKISPVQVALRQRAADRT